ncbi:hypothetical protein JCM10213_007957 [Rhodosporidiobolus nylandii]
MSDLKKGKCCLCGGETVQRCGSCAKYNLSLFFCSKDHQRLIWPTHKLLCGERSNPARWPALTDQEVAYVQSIRKKPFTKAGETHTIEEVHKGASKSLDDTLWRLKHPDHPDRFWYNVQLRALRTKQLWYRHFSGTLTSPGPIPLALLVASELAQQMSGCVRAVYQRAISYDEFDADVETKLMHMLVAIGVVVEMWLRDSGPKTDTARCLQTILLNLKEYVLDELPTERPEMANLLKPLPGYCWDVVRTYIPMPF